MNTATATVALADGTTRRVDGYVAAPDLIVHRCLDDSRRWVVTHVSGKHLGRQWGTRRDAVATAIEAAAVLAAGDLTDRLIHKALWRVVRLDRTADVALQEAAADLGRTVPAVSPARTILEAAGWHPTDDWGGGICKCEDAGPIEPDGACSTCGPNPLRVAGLI